MFRVIHTAIVATVLLVVIIHVDPLGVVHEPICPTEAC